MIRYEIKKIFSKSLSKVSLVVLLFSLLISCYFAITNVSFLDEQGKSHTGIAAAKSLREEKQKWKGVLDEAALQAVLDEYKKISEEYPIRPGDDSANLLHDSKVQGFSEIKDMINMGFCEFRDFNYYRIDSLSKEEVGQIYENRGKSLEKWLNSEDADGLFDENEKAFLIEQYREMKAPLYYEDYDGWKSALSYAQTIIMLIMLVSAFLVSGIFSNEFSWKSDSIFFSTKYGRDRGTRAKIMAGFIVVSVIYFIVISLYSLVVLGCLGSQGGNVMIQTGFWHWKSFYNINQAAHCRNSLCDHCGISASFYTHSKDYNKNYIQNNIDHSRNDQEIQWRLGVTQRTQESRKCIICTCDNKTCINNSHISLHRSHQILR